MQAPSLFDGFPFDAFPPLENCRSSSEVNVDRRQVVPALVIVSIVVVLDELADAQLELARQVIVLQHDADLLFGRMVPTGISTDVPDCLLRTVRYALACLSHRCSSLGLR